MHGRKRMTSGAVKFTFPDFDDIVRVSRADGGVDIMVNGVVFDRIEPIGRLPTTEENEAFLRRYHELVAVISEQWNDPAVSPVEAVQEQRRDFAPDRHHSFDEQGGE